MSTLLIVLIVLAVLIIWAVFMYNGLITRVNRTKEAWADIDVQLKRRHNLIPNLVESVKGYAAHERGTLDEVTQARTQASQVHVDASNITAEQMTAMAGAESTLGGMLGKLMMVAESYPDLKANQNFLQLQKELGDTEDKIQSARRFYNSNVRDLNIAVQQFPTNVMANMFHISSQELFELEEKSEARKPVAVKF